MDDGEDNSKAVACGKAHPTPGRVTKAEGDIASKPGGDAVRYTGLIITAVGGLIRVATVFELGHRFSIFVALQPDHRLKTDGYYRFVRHPSYLGALLAMAGWALVFRSIIGLLLTVAMCVAIIARIRAEEEFLVQEFGDQYRAYQQRTRWRLFPSVY